MAHSDSESVVAPYFRDLQQQQEVNALGMWTFLVTEVMLFGGIFLAFAVYFSSYPDAFTAASQELNIILSTVNTFVLLCSSLTMALAVRSAQIGNSRMLFWFLVLTIILGATFLGFKAFEYYEDYEHNLIPGLNFQFEEPYFGQAQLFYGLYFAATGVHGIHMIIGGSILIYLAYRAWHGAYGPENYDVVENMGLFWHFVDIAWVFIFPLFYLIQR